MMHFLVFLIYPALLACVFYGIRFPIAKTCHETPFGSIQTKAVCGILSVCIILHHLSQKAAIQLPAKDPARIALEPFREIGYLFVAYFFFCSGFGLFKSLSSVKKFTPKIVFSFLLKRPILSLNELSEVAFLPLMLLFL